MIGRLHALQFHVDDVDAAARWYAGLLGATVHHENARYAYVRGAGIELGFHPADAKSPASTGGTVGYFTVKDLDSALAALTRAGAKLWRGPMTTARGERVCQVTDPFGGAFGLIQAPLPAAD